MSPNIQFHELQYQRSDSIDKGLPILTYSSLNGVATTTIRVCSHGNNYELCCHCLGKDVNRENDHNNRVQIERIDRGHYCHSEEPRAIDKKARRRILYASGLCLLFMTGEAVGGYFADSLAIMTDAAHMLTDFASYMVSLTAIWISCRPATKRMNFGWYRVEVIGVLVSVLMIWVLTGVLVFLAVERIRFHQYKIDAVIMLITSGIGVGVNIIIAFTLQPDGQSMSQSNTDGQDDQHESQTTRRKTNMNVRAAFIHVIGDIIQSVGVFIAALIIYFKPAWAIADPICTFIFCVLVLSTTFSIMKDTLNILMEGTPNGVDFTEVQKALTAIRGVNQVHSLRMWSLSAEKVALSAHLAILPAANPREILETATRTVRDKYGFFEMTIQVEDMKADMANCEECQGPKK